MKLSDLLTGVVINKSFLLSRNAKAKAAKDGITLHAELDFSLVTVEAAVDKAASQAIIAFQNGNRKNYDSFENGQHLEIPVTSAGRQIVVDPMVAMRARYANADTDGERQAILDEITAS